MPSAFRGATPLAVDHDEPIHVRLAVYPGHGSGPRFDVHDPDPRPCILSSSSAFPSSLDRRGLPQAIWKRVVHEDAVDSRVHIGFGVWRIEVLGIFELVTVNHDPMTGGFYDRHGRHVRASDA